jgi:uncharacterized membrane protein
MAWSLCLVVITIVICSTIVVSRWLNARQPSRPLATADPAAVLAERYARGEIEEAEYAHRLSVIRLGPPLELH